MAHPLGILGAVDAEHGGAARRGLEDRGEHPDDGGLAGTVRAKETEHRAPSTSRSTPRTASTPPKCFTICSVAIAGPLHGDETVFGLQRFPCVGGDDRGDPGGLRRGLARRRAAGGVARRSRPCSLSPRASPRPGVAMTDASLMPWFSGTKLVTATAVVQLWDRGRLDLAQTVASVIPEFAAHGKDAVTITHVLTHTGGFRRPAGTDEMFIGGIEPGALLTAHLRRAARRRVGARRARRLSPGHRLPRARRDRAARRRARLRRRTCPRRSSNRSGWLTRGWR